MAVKFPEEIHPKYKKRIKFDYDIRAIQYLDFFGIVSMAHKNYKYFPLDLKFDSYEALTKYLYDTGIVSDEIFVHSTFNQIKETYTIVDTRLIYESDEDIKKNKLQFKYYTVNQVADMLSFSRPTIYKLINDGKLKAVRINNQLRIKHLELVSFVSNSKNKLESKK